MRTTTLTLATNDLITTYGNTAKNVINAYRVGNARAASYVEKTWSAAVQKAGKRISGEVRRNALNAQKKLTGYYVQGVTFTTDGADAAVDKAVELAGKRVILVDDIFPNHPVQARRDRSSRHWTGDVWKFVSVLKSARPKKH